MVLGYRVVVSMVLGYMVVVYLWYWAIGRGVYGIGL